MVISDCRLCVAHRYPSSHVLQDCSINERQTGGYGRWNAIDVIRRQLLLLLLPPPLLPSKSAWLHSKCVVSARSSN
jgi:hypothetical protein